MEINYKALNSNEIRTLINKKIKYAEKYFGGVYASDMLPKVEFSLLRAFIVNTQTSSEPGEHWVAMYIDAKRTGEFFDSYGLPPVTQKHRDFLDLHCKRWSYNKVPLQSLESSLCGHYCCLYVAAKVNGTSLKDLVKTLKKKDRYNNDGNVIMLFSRVFQMAPRSTQSIRGGGGKVMTCCSRRACARNC